MEKNKHEIEIVKIITELISNYLYLGKIEQSDDIKDIFMNLPKDLINDFNLKYGSFYKDILIENALIYALENNKYDYLKIYKENQYKIVGYLNDNKDFQYLTLDFAIKTIFKKIVKNIDNSENIKAEYREIFEDNYDYIFINELYRVVLLEIIRATMNQENQTYNLLDQIFYTSKMNSIIQKQFSTFTEDDIELFKYILMRFILADNFVYFESLKADIEMDEFLCELEEASLIDNDFDLEDFNIEGIKEYDAEVDEEILDYIYECIKYNNFIFPEDKSLRYRIYDNFIKYNIDINSKEYDLIKVEDNNKTLELKKINPLYLLEKKDF